MRAVKLAISGLILLLLAGCWGSRETDEIAYVLAMGIDKGPGKFITVTFQIANPKVISGLSGGGGGGMGGAGGGNRGGGQPLLTNSTVAPLPFAAVMLLNTERSREVSLLHTNVYIFSEELAREGLHHYLAALNRYRETRGTAYIYISRGKARDFMEKNQPVLEYNPSKQFELFSRSSRLTSLFPVVQYREFYQATKSRAREPVAPLVGINRKGLKAKSNQELGVLGDYLAGEMPSDKDETQILGAAVFKGDKMVGEITGDEARYFIILTGKLERSLLTIEDPESKGIPLGLLLRQAKRPDVEVKFTPEGPVIREDVYIEPEIVGLASGIGYESPGKKKVPEKALAELIERRCLELVTRCQEEFRSDIIGYGRYARMHFLTRKEWEQADWISLFPTARVEIKVHVKIRRTGMLLKLLPVHY